MQSVILLAPTPGRAKTAVPATPGLAKAEGPMLQGTFYPLRQTLQWISLLSIFPFGFQDLTFTLREGAEAGRRLNRASQVSCQVLMRRSGPPSQPLVARGKPPLAMLRMIQLRLWNTAWTIRTLLRVLPQMTKTIGVQK